jgi:hypothetical protein
MKNLVAGGGMSRTWQYDAKDFTAEGLTSESDFSHHEPTL